jgi:hypothetical protein
VPNEVLLVFPPIPVSWQAEKGILQEHFLEIFFNTFAVSESQKIDENSGLHNSLAR